MRSNIHLSGQKLQTAFISTMDSGWTPYIRQNPRVRGTKLSFENIRMTLFLLVFESLAHLMTMNRSWKLAITSFCVNASDSCNFLASGHLFVFASGVSGGQILTSLNMSQVIYL